MMCFLGQKLMKFPKCQIWLCRHVVWSARRVATARKRHVRASCHRKAIRCKGAQGLCVTHRGFPYGCCRSLFQHCFCHSFIACSAVMQYFSRFAQKCKCVLLPKCVLSPKVFCERRFRTKACTSDKPKFCKAKTCRHKIPEQARQRLSRKKAQSAYPCPCNKAVCPLTIGKAQNHGRQKDELVKDLEQICSKTNQSFHEPKEHKSISEAKVVSRSFVGGAKATHKEQDDLLTGLQKLLQAQTQQSSHNTQTGELLQALKALVRKAEHDLECDLLTELRNLVQTETKRRSKKSQRPQKEEPAWQPSWRPAQQPAPKPVERGATRWNQRKQGSTGHNDWHEVRWNLRHADWDAAMTSDLGMFRSPDMLGQALDQKSHEAYLCHAPTQEEWTEMYGLLDSQKDVAATLVLPKHIGEPEELKQEQRIPGMMGSKLQHRKCWVASWGEAPILKRKLNLHDPDLKTAFDDAKKGQETFVVRLSAPGNYQTCNWQNWNRLVKAPGSAARLWAQSILGNSYSLGDTFKFELIDEKNVRGMLRVHTRAAAESLIASSGHYNVEAGQRWFCEAVSQNLQTHNIKLAWIPWHQRESWHEYAERCRRQDSQGLVHGRHQLALRVAEGDPRIVPRPS